jgi:hypothetical protein
MIEFLLSFLLRNHCSLIEVKENTIEEILLNRPTSDVSALIHLFCKETVTAFKLDLFQHTIYFFRKCLSFA